MDKEYYQVVLTDESYLVFGKKATNVIINDKIPDVLWFLNDEGVTIGIVPIKEVKHIRLCKE